jgi:hypothetical protein
MSKIKFVPQTSTSLQAADVTPPVITIIGDNPMTLVQNQTYNEPGATAQDNEDGTVPVNTSGSVNTSEVGTNTITYTATDSAGNSTTATRTVNVTDGMAPVITILGDNPLSLLQNSTYNEPGATATDNVDGSVPVTIGGDTVDTSVIGTNTITYTATDASGNSSTATRTVNVTDGVAPVITILGDNPMSIKQNETYSEPGATAQDAYDGNVNVYPSGSVNNQDIGTNTITYTATDAANNVSTATRTVNVTDGVAPVITLLGDVNYEQELDEPYNEPGATAQDNVDGATSVTIGGDTVDTSTVGNYTVTYTTTDSAGNSSTRNRVVTVVGPPPLTNSVLNNLRIPVFVSSFRESANEVIIESKHSTCYIINNSHVHSLPSIYSVSDGTHLYTINYINNTPTEHYVSKVLLSDLNSGDIPVVVSVLLPDCSRIDQLEFNGTSLLVVYRDSEQKRILMFLNTALDFVAAHTFGETVFYVHCAEAGKTLVTTRPITDHKFVELFAFSDIGVLEHSKSIRPNQEECLGYSITEFISTSYGWLVIIHRHIGDNMAFDVICLSPDLTILSMKSYDRANPDGNPIGSYNALVIWPTSTLVNRHQKLGSNFLISCRGFVRQQGAAQSYEGNVTTEITEDGVVLEGRYYIYRDATVGAPQASFPVPLQSAEYGTLHPGIKFGRSGSYQTHNYIAASSLNTNYDSNQLKNKMYYTSFGDRNSLTVYSTAITSVMLTYTVTLVKTTGQTITTERLV